MRNADELLELSKRLAPDFPYSVQDIFSFFVSLDNFDWRTLSDDTLRDLLNERMMRGY